MGGARARELRVPSHYLTIQSAINSANHGDTVVVADGIYTGQGNRDIHLNRRITVRSENGPENCIIDCNGSQAEPHRAFDVRTYSTIAGFTIINGWAERGGAILTEGCENLEILNCVLKNNIAQRWGGAIFTDSTTNAYIINCSIIDNNSLGGGGGGIYCEGTDLLIQNTVIKNNLCTGGGGGIACWMGSNITVQNCVISENMSNGDGICNGGGISCSERNGLIIKDSKIKNNIVRSEYFASGGGIHCSKNTNLLINNSDVTGNICEGIECIGGGIYYTMAYHNNKKCIITNSTIKNNALKTAEDRYRSCGGGMYFEDTRLLISKCIINNNSAYQGAGIFCDSGKLLLSGCIISGNHPLSEADYRDSSGIHCEESSLNINDCTIAGNSPSGIQNDNGDTTVHNSILYYNGYVNIIADCYGYQPYQTLGFNCIKVTYSNIQTEGSYPWFGEGNINTDPCFVQPGYWDANSVWSEGNYHLLPHSLCIDAGKSSAYQLDNTDLDGNPRTNGGRIDMGAYETIWQQACLQIRPRIIKRDNRQSQIMAWMRLPQGITSEQVNEDKPLILYPGSIKAAHQYTFENHKAGTTQTYIIAYFNKTKLMNAVPENGRVKLQAVGQLESGQYFYGTDTVRIIAPKIRRRPYGHIFK